MWHERIVETALILGDEYGDESLTAELVAESAGLSRAHLYKFFPTRDDIRRAVLFARASRLAEQLLAEVAAARTSEAKVRLIVERLYSLAAASGTASVGWLRQDAGLGELLHGFRQRLAPDIGRELLPASASDDSGVDAGLIGHAVLAMAEGGAMTSAKAPAASRRASVDAVVTLIREVLLSAQATPRPGDAGSRGRTARPGPGRARPRR